MGLPKSYEGLWISVNIVEVKSILRSITKNDLEGFGAGIEVPQENDIPQSKVLDNVIVKVRARVLVWIPV